MRDDHKLGESVPRVEELYSRLDIPINQRMVSLVYSKCSEFYSTNSRYEVPVRSRCLHRVLEHLLHFGDCAKNLIEYSESTELRLPPFYLSILGNKTLDNQSGAEEQDVDSLINLDSSDDDLELDPLQPTNHESQVIESIDAVLDDDIVFSPKVRKSPFTLWMRAGVLIHGSESLGERSPDFHDELILCGKAIEYLKHFAYSDAPEEPTSAVLDVVDEISASLSARRQRLYKRLAKRRGHWVDYDYLVAEVWNDVTDPASDDQEVLPASIDREIRRMNEKIAQFGWRADYDVIDGHRKARLCRTPEEPITP